MRRRPARSGSAPRSCPFTRCTRPRCCRRRPRTLELAGELADGVIVWMATPEYVMDTVLPAIRRGRAAAGLSLEGFEIMVIVNICGTEDVDFGREMVSKMLQPALRFDAYRSL